jgi:hypothetical protein
MRQLPLRFYLKKMSDGEKNDLRLFEMLLGFFIQNRRINYFNQQKERKLDTIIYLKI